MMINEWIRTHKKTAITIAISILVGFGLLITLVANNIQNSDPHEEDEMRASVVASNLDVLYTEFSDTEIGTIFAALNTALVTNQSMKNGSPASENKTPAADAIDEELYPGSDQGRYTLTVKDGKITYYEDSWGKWKTFVVTTNDNRTFKVDVAIGAHNREQDVSYTPITITKQ